MKNDLLDKFFDAFPVINKICTGFLILYSIGAGVYKGVTSKTTSELVAWIVGGLIGGLFIMITFLVLDFGIKTWEKLTNWLSGEIRKHLYARLLIIFPVILLAFYTAYIVFSILEVDLSLKIFISIYLIWVLPAAIISLTREDMNKEQTILSKKVSREIRIQNPQAAIENAFTHFEDHLHKRLSGDPKLFGNRLIKAAYEGEKSRLVFKSSGKDYTTHLNNLMSGAYSILRNPRHHKIIEDDEKKAQVIISLVELLIEFIDTSEDRKIEQATGEIHPAQNE